MEFDQQVKDPATTEERNLLQLEILAKANSEMQQLFKGDENAYRRFL